MIDMHNGYYTMPEPLTYSDAIYWDYPAVQQEYAISWSVLKYANVDIRAEINARIRATSRDEVRALAPDWARWITIVSEYERDYCTIIRHTYYEQPGYKEIKLYRAPSSTQSFRIMPQGGAMIELPLRQLSYYGGTARGALHDNILYLVI